MNLYAERAARAGEGPHPPDQRKRKRRAPRRALRDDEIFVVTRRNNLLRNIFRKFSHKILRNFFVFTRENNYFFATFLVFTRENIFSLRNFFVFTRQDSLLRRLLRPHQTKRTSSQPFFVLTRQDSLLRRLLRSLPKKFLRLDQTRQSESQTTSQLWLSKLPVSY